MPIEDLPSQYKWLKNEPAPKMLLEALRHFGTQEFKGDLDNPIILGWAKELGGETAEFYKHDSIPWCGLFMGIVAKRSGYEPPKYPLLALNWASFGTPVKLAKLGYVLVFMRNGGGHVGLYVGEDKFAYHVLGGNQHDMVDISRIDKRRLYSINRPNYKIKEPANVRQIFLSEKGIISTDES